VADREIRASETNNYYYKHVIMIIFINGMLSSSVRHVYTLIISWSEVASIWSELALVWSQVTFGWGKMTGDEMTGYPEICSLFLKL